MLSIIVAMNKHGAIGLNKTIPWYHAADLRHFKETTLGHKVVMGRITLQNMTKVLKNRDVFCVSHQDTVELPSGQPVTMIHDLVAFCKEHQDSEETIFIAGGSKIYETAMPYVSQMIVSFIDYDGPADTYFKSFIDEGFTMSHYEQKEGFEVITYRRK